MEDEEGVTRALRVVGNEREVMEQCREQKQARNLPPNIIVRCIVLTSCLFQRYAKCSAQSNGPEGHRQPQLHMDWRGVGRALNMVSVFRMTISSPPGRRPRLRCAQPPLTATSARPDRPPPPAHPTLPRSGKIHAVSTTSTETQGGKQVGVKQLQAGGGQRFPVPGIGRVGNGIKSRTRSGPR